MRALTFVVLIWALVSSCSDDDPAQSAAPASSSSGSGGIGGTGGSPPACFDYASFTPAPGVSFVDDVMPIFAAHCNALTCHGNLTTPDGKLYLGKKTDIDEATLNRVYDNLVDVASTRAPAMKRVAPGDPERSFLLVKLDAAFSCPAVQCTELGCGAKMPYGFATPQLELNVRNLIRSWIENGAPRNSGGTGGMGGMGGAAGAGG